MSEQESDIGQSGSDGAWEATDQFSSSGNDSGGPAVAMEGPVETELDDRSQFLADLARVMQTTAAAEQARKAEGTEQRRQAHLDSIRAREAIEAEELRQVSKDDVKGIDAWSEGEIKRIKLERERRIAARREQLQIRLEEHRSVVAREVAAVEAAVALYRAEIDEFFGRLEAETDPVAIASYAGSQPPFPDLALLGPDDAPVGTDYGYVVSTGPSAEAGGSDDGSHHDGPHDEGTSGREGEMVGVMDPDASNRPVETPWESGIEAGAEAEAAQGSEGTETPDMPDTPEPVVAEARVVMPRSSGAGSWLRWPSSSVDRSDPTRQV